MMVINAIQSDEGDLDRLETRLKQTNTGYNCIYLAADGCLWRVKPIVCQMFLCDKAHEQVSAGDPSLRNRWKALKHKEKEFTWPDKVVLFDQIESAFLDNGCISSLMYLHNSPGLLRLKRQAGL